MSTGLTWFKECDNGHYKTHSESMYFVTDNNNGEALVFSGEGVSNNQGNDSVYPFSVQYNYEAFCFDGTESLHGGITMYKDDTVPPHHEFDD